MGSAAERRLKAQGACDRAYAERVRILPMRAGGAVLGGADPAFRVYETVGIYREVAALQTVRGTGQGRGEKLEARGARHAVSFALGAVGGDERPTPRDGWHVRLLERPGEPEFRIVPSAFGAAGRISFDLVPLGSK